MEIELYIQVAKEGSVSCNESRATESAKMGASLCAQDIHTSTTVYTSGAITEFVHRRVQRC